MDLISRRPTNETRSNTLKALDCVDRQAAIDEFEKELSAKYNKREMAIGFVGVKSILQGLPSARPDQHWIPCSERLPDMCRTYYLVSLADKKEVDIAYFTEYGTWETFRNDEVKAWIPLPEPWRGEEHD